MDQQGISAFLRRQNAEHVREEMMLPTLEYQVSYNDELVREFDCITTQGTQFRVDGREDNRLAPGPLELATIGSNFRDPTTGQVHAFGFDIDGTNHAAGHDNLESWIERFQTVEWLHIYRSRSGRGVHLIAPLGREIFATDNSELVALGAAMKVRLAEQLQDEGVLDIVDCAGGIMYFYSPNPGEHGYELIKPATQLFTESITPLYDPGDPDFEVQDLKELEHEHARLVEYMGQYARKDFSQRGMVFHAHTSDLAAAHKALGLKGHFETVSSGQGDTKRNCWLRPIAGGGWIVGQWGSSNEKSWKESKRGGRYCLLNVAPTLADFVKDNSIDLEPRSKSYCFSVEQAEEFATLQGQSLPETDAEFIMVQETDGKVTFTVDVKPSQVLDGPWRRRSKQKACWSLATPFRKVDPSSRVRVAFCKGGKNFQPYRKVYDYWHPTTMEDAHNRLAVMGLSPLAATRVLSTDIPFEIVSEPFKPEFIGSRQWNRGAVQFSLQPASEPGDYTHWQMILDHVGRGLNQAVANDGWCREFGIITGADYLRLWCARMFRFPKQRLPGLGLFSPDQNCGKSTFFGSMGKLMTRGGYLNSASPLTSNFNGPLLGCVLWDLDDIDLSQRSGELYRKLQPWMTHDELVVEGKGLNPVTVSNSLHIGHTANQLECFAIQPGDTRWVIAEVGPLENEIPSATFTRALMREAPYYLRALFDLPMPAEAAGRMFLSVLDTSIKNRLMVARSERALTPEQTTWLKKLRELGEAGRLTTLTPFNELKELMNGSHPPSAKALQGAWPKLSVALEDAGFKVSNRLNERGNCPAAWSVSK